MTSAAPTSTAAASSPSAAPTSTAGSVPVMPARLRSSRSAGSFPTGSGSPYRTISRASFRLSTTKSAPPAGTPVVGSFRRNMVRVPARLPASTSKSWSPIMSSPLTATPNSLAASCTESGKGFGLTGMSRVRMVPKWASSISGRWANAVSTAARLFRVMMAIGTWCARRKATSSTAPSLGRQRLAASSSAKLRTASLRARSSGSVNWLRNSSSPTWRGQPTASWMAAKSMAPGLVSVPSKSKMTPVSRKGLPSERKGEQTTTQPS